MQSDVLEKEVRNPSTDACLDVRLPLLPFGDLTGTWHPDECEQAAAWELYVEVISRVTLKPPDSDDRTLREALASISALADATRDILRRFGVRVAQPGTNRELSFGMLAILLVSRVLSPGVSRCHLLLKKVGGMRGGSGTIGVESEKELNEAVVTLHSALMAYAELLAGAAGIPSMHDAVTQLETEPPREAIEMDAAEEEEEEDTHEAVDADPDLENVAEATDPQNEPAISLPASDPLMPGSPESFSDRFRQLRDSLL